MPSENRARRKSGIAKRFPRHIGEKTNQRDILQEQIGRLANEANNLGEPITNATRCALDEARRSLANIASASDYNQFVRDFIGPMALTPKATSGR